MLNNACNETGAAQRHHVPKGGMSGLIAPEVCEELARYLLLTAQAQDKDRDKEQEKSDDKEAAAHGQLCLARLF